MDEAEIEVHELIGREAERIGRGFDDAAVHDGTDHIIQLLGGAEADGIGEHIGDAAGAREDEHDLVIVLRPASGGEIKLRIEQLAVVDHLIEEAGGLHHRVRLRSRAHALREIALDDAGVGLQELARRVAGIDLRRDAVAVGEGIQIRLNLVIVLLEIALEALEVVRADLGEEARHERALGDRAVRLLLGVLFVFHDAGDHAGHVGGLGHDRERIG